MRRPAGKGDGARRAGRLVGCLVTTSLVLAACGGGGGTPQASSKAGTPNPDGVLRFGVDLNDGFSNDFDPGTGTNDCSFEELSQIYSSITDEPGGTEGNNEILPGVAQSWQISGSTLTLHIRPDIEFSDGEPVTASAVMQSIEHVRTSPLRTSLLAIVSMDPTNATTLVIQLKQPPTPGDLLLAFSFIDGMVMAPSSIASAATKPVGAGPFVLKSYQPGAEIALVANKNYWDKSAYKLGGVDFVQLTEGPQQIGALIAGAVDMIELMPEDYATAKADSNIGIAVTPSYQYMLMQLRENSPPFNNPGVRAALEYAVNRAEINKIVLKGLGQPAYQPFPSTSPGYNPTVGNKYTYQPAKAKAMLSQAGYPHGVGFDLVFPAGVAEYQSAAEIMKAELAPAGFNVSITQVPPADILTDVYENKEANAVLIENSSNGPDLANNFESSYEGTGFVSQALGSFNASVTTLVKKASYSISASFQGPYMQQASAIVMSQGLEIPIAFIPEIVAYNKIRVGGNVVAPIGICKANLAGIYIKK
ncbi:MAG TPA: ABC transporter substrate-binding protein [Acidimicrobiales bacterium]|nr:ABC transporter substrate-binding protein [Acidimicrobiales bacterium]